ncbi:hypothetical protein AMTRI_Chr08g209100 [Amborella trichopoda]|uniref:RNA-directed DNA methylation 4 n=1 Tax=Amborella trichopoda TaxID=13333 RepID=UPI0005D3D6F6|nr:RNA-directed DNA methylation 4 [Amborella trichopoda]XP_020522366.1 RNA-directed DNA methylation 4 [Amborella trichopoda]XP_020522367.1 RNA-directed DNA methylation 4 [Amborella trichopoda]XP_020522368.1 RNA-directed DNA methylation 4 [Amborella trichopoda]|eukprot:XP_011623067.1 RNA-directed DNA methylation 4 [Amborella trichopoda]
MDSKASSSKNHASTTISEKPVIVRVKRKANQAPVDALWLEINDRPLKRATLDISALSISDSIGKEEVKATRILVQRVETISSSEAIQDILLSVVPNVNDAKTTGAKTHRPKLEERRLEFKQDKKQEQLRSSARQKQEDLAKSARFEQIWKSRKGNEEAHHDSFVREFCHLYDVVRVDEDERSSDRASRQNKKDRGAALDEGTILCNYLPMLREWVPDAADEIEAELNASHKQDEYVYDVYAVDDNRSPLDSDASCWFPSVQIEEELFGDEPADSGEETDDSNAENNPRNDYPDESSEDEDLQSKSSSYLSEEPNSDDDRDGDYYYGNDDGDDDDGLDHDARGTWMYRR